MAYFACHVCGTEGIVGVCDKCKHVEKVFKELEDRMHKAESHAYWMEQKLQTLLRETSQQIESGVKEISVPRQLLTDLIDAATRSRDKGKFWTDTILAMEIVCDAADMLRSRGTPMFPKVFGMLKKHIERYWELHGWKKDRLEPGSRLSRNIWDAEPLKLNLLDRLFGAG